MAGPLAGVGQSAPQITSFQQNNAGQNGATSQARENQQLQPPPPPADRVQESRDAQPAQAQTTETDNQDVLQRDLASALDVGQSFGPDSSAPRGSVVDIEV